jgi:hypothetical protein
MGKQPNILFELVGKTIITIYGEAAPTNEEIEKWISFAVERKGRFDGILGYSHGGSQTAIQRKRIREAFPTLPPVAVITDSIAARMAVTAFNLFVDLKVKTFSPRELNDALLYLKTPPEERDAIKQALTRMQRELRLNPL